MDSKNAKSAVSVLALEKSPEWMYWLDVDSMELSPVLGGNLARRRQDSRGAYLLNGAMYLIERELFLQSAAFVHLGTLACPMTKDDSVDIDTIEDLSAAEKILADSMGLN